MLARKHTMALSHAGSTHGLNNNPLIGNNRNRTKIPATVIWSGVGQPALIVANGRKLVNPVNGLSVNMRGMAPPPPPLPPSTFSTSSNGAGGGYANSSSGKNKCGNNFCLNPVSSGGSVACCSCCYCCCDTDRNSVGGSHHSHSSSSVNSRHATTKLPPHRSKTWRRRSKSKETLSSSGSSVDVRKLICRSYNESSAGTKPKFVPVTTLEDAQAIRCAEFHPKGNYYAVGSNSKTLRICSYPSLANLSEDHIAKSPQVIFKKMKHHRGSIYCLGWSPDGNLLATGSNDKTVKLTRFDEISRQDFSTSQEIELTMHDGTIRDVCFIEDLSNKSSLLVSGGAGDCKIYVTDCVTATPFQALSGHSGPILSLYNWGGAMFCSGSQDKSIRFWDLRTRGCVNLISPLTSATSSTTKSPVGSVCVDPTGRLLVSGHEDSAVVLYDIRGNRQIQTFKPHSSEVRSVRFSPSAYYLLSAGYDQRLMLTDLQGDLSLNLMSVPVGSHSDKIISGRWHPTDFSFLSTSADKTATLWGLPSQ